MTSPNTDQRLAADRERRMRADLETGFTDYESAVGYVICPARQKCPTGLLGIFKPLADGRLPMHRHWLGEPCEGARKKPITPPLQLRPATPAAARPAGAANEDSTAGVNA